jgi:hypothetical protein
MNSGQKSSGRGCLFWGGIIAAVLLLCFLLTVYAGYRYVRHLVNEYTDSKPIEVATLRLSDAEMTNLQARVKSFNDSMESNKPVGPLVLTADEINALVNRAAKTNTEPMPRLYFSFNEDRVQAQVSIPLDGIGLQMLRGRYFNGSGDLSFSLNNGRVVLNVKSLSVKGKPVPEQWMQGIRSQNLADTWTNDPNFGSAFSRLESIRIHDGKLIIVPNTNAVVMPATNQIKAPDTNEVQATTNLESGK